MLMDKLFDKQMMKVSMSERMKISKMVKESSIINQGQLLKAIGKKVVFMVKV